MNEAEKKDDFSSSVILYNKETGIFRWPDGTGKFGGMVAGHRNSRGYIQIRVNYKLYYAHRLAWMVCHGEWPECQIDHIDGDKSNNKISNLRLATNSQNQANIPRKSSNTSGMKGVSWSRRHGKWEARTEINNVIQFLGYFDDICDAKNAYDAAHKKNFGDFSRV